MFSWGSIYYFHHYNPQRRAQAHWGISFLELLERSSWKNHSWKLGIRAYLLKHGTWKPGLGRGERRGWWRDCLLIPHDLRFQ